jgi:hypothetical protein
MAEKIDPALVQLARQYPREIFMQDGYAIQYTSTCTDMPARWPVHTKRQWTPMLYASIAATFDNRASWLRSYQQRLHDAGEPFGRGERTVEKAISLFPKSE